VVQAEITAAEAQPVGTIQTPFDFYLRTSQPGANFLAWHSPVISIPVHGVIVGHRACALLCNRELLPIPMAYWMPKNSQNS
jgi:hypothetical protein